MPQRSHFAHSPLRSPQRNTPDAFSASGVFFVAQGMIAIALELQLLQAVEHHVLAGEEVPRVEDLIELFSRKQRSGLVVGL